MTLEVQTLLRLHGLQHVKDYLKLEVKECGDLVLLKYNQIEADWTKTALHDCRGLILDRSKGWEIVAFPYAKFFNLEEGYCAKIDWDNCMVYEKSDGSLITLYRYKDEWCVSTTGTPDASSTANAGEYTFAQLFWNAAAIMYGSKDAFVERLDTNLNYMFELCTPYNIVVTQHSESRIFLHGARDMRTLKEVHITDMDLVKVKTHDLRNEADIRATFANMTWQDEGYIVCDTNFNRAKIKNPSYVAVHHVKSGVSPYEIVNVVKQNEIDEFCVYFKERIDFIMLLKKNWDALEAKLIDTYEGIKGIELQRDFALKVIADVEKPFHSIMFGLRSGRLQSARDGMCGIDNRFLYNYLQN